MTMEIRLKERLIGATVLVLAAVLFVPMLLDGPGGRQVSQQVPLPAPGNGDERRTVRIDLDAPTGARPVTPSSPPAENDEPAAVDLTARQETSASQSTPDSRPAATQQPVTRSEPADGGPVRHAPPAEAEWTVQVGAFGRQANADALAEKLKQLGYAAFVSQVKVASGVHYRVRVGGFPTREAAQNQADEIRQRTGEPARPVSVD